MKDEIIIYTRHQSFGIDGALFKNAPLMTTVAAPKPGKWRAQRRRWAHGDRIIDFWGDSINLCWILIWETGAAVIRRLRAIVNCWRRLKCSLIKRNPSSTIKLEKAMSLGDEASISWWGIIFMGLRIAGEAFCFALLPHHRIWACVIPKWKRCRTWRQCTLPLTRNALPWAWRDFYYIGRFVLYLM